MAASTLAQPVADGGATLCGAEVELFEVRPGGVLWVLLFAESQAKAFPVHRDKALQRIDVAPADAGTTVVSFEGLACGQYGVAVVHDENANGKLDTKIFGIPREGLGSSRDARGFLGPPSFDDAKVLLSTPRTHVPIRVTY